MSPHKFAVYKTHLLGLGLVLAGVSIFSLSFPAQASAQIVDIQFDSKDGSINLGAGDDQLGDFCDGGYLLGIFPPWNRGIDDCDKVDLSDEFATQDKTRTIIANITSILTRLAGLAAVIALIVSGFKYILSQGNSQKAAGALKSVIHALSGLAVAVAATLLVETIHGRLTDGAKTSAGLPKVEPSLPDTIGFVMLIIGLLSVLMIVLQGMRYALSQGNAEKTTAARNGIIYSMVGAAVALTSWSFVQFVLGRLVVSDSDTPGTAGISDLMASVVGILVFIVGVISVIMVIVGSYQYIFSGGDSQKASSARGTIIYALIGVVIAIAAAPMLTWVLGRL